MDTFTVKLDMTDSSAKMDIVVDWSNDRSMGVKSVSDGLIQTWNLQNPDKVVRVKDHIYQVNGSHGTGEQLLSACRMPEPLELLIARPSAPANAQ